MKYLLTGKQMKEADQYTIHEIGIPSEVLMERAALQVVDTIMEKKLDTSNVLVICGAGNNGGDGYAIARMLKIQGCSVSVCFMGKEESRTVENQLQKKIAEYYQVKDVGMPFHDTYSLIVDALFGIGLKRNIENEYSDLIAWANEQEAYRLAVDIPSGIHDSTGKVMGIAFRADCTVAIAYKKAGIVLQPGNEYAGEVVVAEIGIYDDALSEKETIWKELEWEDFQRWYPKRKSNSHKGSYGKVLMIVGSYGMAGAAYLCAKACYMSGAGLVQIYTHESNRLALQELLPEAVVSTYENYEEETLKALLDWADVVTIGCGLGQSDCSKQILQCVMENNERPCVIDADAINLLAKQKDWLKNRKFSVVMTPHVKEFSRLTDDSISDIQEKRISLLKQVTDEYHLTCILKDARTVIGDEKGNIFINLTGNHGMAKAGSGDVLAGIVSGILAQNVNGFQSAVLAAFLHGVSGDFAKKKKGAYGMLADDLINEIALVLKEV